ncbi:MAG: glycine cleavage system protein GcvH [Acidimicrobiales bacterium]
MNVPDDLQYSSDHEWIRVEGNRATIGITDYAQDALGDIVFVQVPDQGATVTAGASISEVESTKSVSDIYAPLAGTIVEVNADLDDAPEKLNADPYGDGWICVIEIDAAGAPRPARRRGIPLADRGLRTWHRPGGERGDERRRLSALWAPQPAGRQLLLLVRAAARARGRGARDDHLHPRCRGRRRLTVDVSSAGTSGLLVVTRGPNTGSGSRSST